MTFSFHRRDLIVAAAAILLTSLAIGAPAFAGKASGYTSCEITEANIGTWTVAGSDALSITTDTTPDGRQRLLLLKCKY